MGKPDRFVRRWQAMGLKGINDQAFVRKGSAQLIMGLRASERMSALGGRVLESVKCGHDPEDVLVVCADPSSASRLRKMLRVAMTSDEDKAVAQPDDSATGSMSRTACVQVLTCRELACSIIEDPMASQVTGVAFSSGRARILGAYETDFLMEDIKTLGTRPKRLRELLKFLYRGWTELSDEDPEWLFTVEELDTFDFLNEELRYLGAVMEPEIANLATKALRLTPSLREKCARGQVFVLDLQNMSRASQLLCQLIASDALVATADETGSVEVMDSYPDLGGIERFQKLNANAQVIDLGACEPAAVPVVASESVKRTSLVLRTPQEEIEHVANAIREEIDAGMDPSDVAVMTLHPWWTMQVRRALDARGIPTNAWPGNARLHGDIRDLDRSLTLRIVTLLRLLADPKDAMAWRSWFGFGDYLTRSEQFRKMRRSVECTGDVRRDLEIFGYDLGTDLDPLFEEVRDLRGVELLSYLTRTLAGPEAAVPSALAKICTAGLDSDAAHMVAAIDNAQFFSGIPEEPGVVVAPFVALGGLDFESVHVVGFVNGLFPKESYFDLTAISLDKQERMGEQDERTAHAMARLGRGSLSVSGFEHAPRDFAERVGLKQARIYADDAGREMSEIEPSIYLKVLLGAE